MAALAVAIWTKAIAASHAADTPAPSAAKLERITEFFNNEVATGKLPGAVVLIPVSYTHLTLPTKRIV